jgi:hypothetical protein
MLSTRLRSTAGLVACLITVPLLAEPASMPVVLQPDSELKELFGYDPPYTANIPTFDSQGRPYIRSRSADLDETAFIHTWREGEWVEIPLLPALQSAFPEFSRTVRAGGLDEARVIFDRDDRLYTVLSIQLSDGSTKRVMLASANFGETFHAVELPAQAVAAEHVSGHNELTGPPFLMIPRRLGDHPGPWARRHELTVTQPRWEGDRIIVPEPVKVSEMLVALGQHSGGSSFAVSRQGKTHFVWAEVTEDEEAPGSPTFIATYDQATGTLSEPIFLTFAPPLNNSHNMPGICLDSEGHLHVVTGSHFGESFFYMRSLQPNDPTAGWTEPAPVWATGWIALSGREAGGQTYVSLVCDPDDTLHLVFRHWQRGIENYPHLAATERDQFAALSYQRKPKGENWTSPRTLIVPERGIYSIYYQKLSVDPVGRLFLSASYMDRILLERSERDRFLRRMVLTSSDGGDTWSFASTDDFAPLPDTHLLR